MCTDGGAAIEMRIAAAAYESVVIGIGPQRELHLLCGNEPPDLRNVIHALDSAQLALLNARTEVVSVSTRAAGLPVAGPPSAFLDVTDGPPSSVIGSFFDVNRALLACGTPNGQHLMTLHVDLRGRIASVSNDDKALRCLEGELSDAAGGRGRVRAATLRLSFTAAP